eukprot:1152316-Pelagomonas_calceolata.AAC.16
MEGVIKTDCPKSRAGPTLPPMRRPRLFKAPGGGTALPDGLIEAKGVPVFTNRAETLLIPLSNCGCTMKPNGHGPTNTNNRETPAGILVALQQGHADVASDSASCLSQISKQTLNPMRMRTHLHAELIKAISHVSEHKPIADKALMHLEAYSRCEEHCYKLAICSNPTVRLYVKRKKQICTLLIGTSYVGQHMCLIHLAYTMWICSNNMLSASKIPKQENLRDLRYRQQRVWREADALSPRQVNRKGLIIVGAEDH